MTGPTPDDENPPPAGVTAEDALRVANESVPGTVMQKLGMEFLEVGLARIRARVPVAGNTQPYGLLHGGVTATLCESVGSFGTAVHAGLDRLVTGIELNLNHLRAVSDGHVTATGTPIHVGRTTAVWDFRVHDDEGRLTAVGRLTVLIRDRTS